APDREPGQRFLGWSGGCSGILRAIELSAVSADVTCGASYVDRVTVAAAVGGGVAGSATVSSADPTAACGAASCTVDVGQSVTVTAPTVDGVRFVGWVGAGACDGATANPLTLTAGAPLTCTATYVERVT